MLVGETGSGKTTQVSKVNALSMFFTVLDIHPFHQPQDFGVFYINPYLNLSKNKVYRGRGLGHYYCTINFSSSIKKLKLFHFLTLVLTDYYRHAIGLLNGTQNCDIF